MNYRHDFHAGNFADVFKHIILVRVLLHLVKKETPFRYIDTHAGSGFYDLFGAQATRTQEWHAGLGRLLSAANVPAETQALIEPYLQLVASAIQQTPGGGHGLYPGSPAIAAALLRSQDRMIYCELHPEAVRELQDYFARERRAKIIDKDGFKALNAFVPPVERRGVILIDPAYEQRDDFERGLQVLEAARRKWNTGIFMLWYPIKDQREADVIFRHFATGKIKRVLRLEMQMADPVPDGPLVSNGLLIVNPPFPLAAEAELILPFLTQTLAAGPAAKQKIEWLAGE
jgi:23S rRNA (adenine2030-N6)-methyltransferase